MANKLFIGNLSYSTSEDTLSQKLSEFGEVVSVKIIMDRATGRSKGFAFAEFADEAAAQSAMEALNGQELDGRKISVQEARPEEKRERPMR